MGFGNENVLLSKTESRARDHKCQRVDLLNPNNCRYQSATKVLQWGSEYRTSLVFKVVR